MIKPSTLLRIFTPSSTALVSDTAATLGVAALSHRLQGVAQTLAAWADLTTGSLDTAAISVWLKARL